MSEDLRNKLNDMFDIEGATIEKTQYNPVGKWVFTLLMTLFFGGVYGLCMWGARLLHGSLYVTVVVILSLALAFVLFRLWFAFGVDELGRRHAESSVFLRRGDDRFYYTRGRFVEKFEYAGGFIAVTGDEYDKFESKADYSPLAGKYERSLGRRSSLYVTMTPSFWYDAIGDWQYSATDGGITATDGKNRVEFTCDERGKIKKIDYEGSGYYLYDSVSPIRIFDGKIAGKYRITYTFDVGAQEQIVLGAKFGEAIEDFLMPRPAAEAVRISPPALSQS